MESLVISEGNTPLDHSTSTGNDYNYWNRLIYQFGRVEEIPMTQYGYRILQEIKILEADIYPPLNSVSKGVFFLRENGASNKQVEKWFLEAVLIRTSQKIQICDGCKSMPLKRPLVGIMSASKNLYFSRGLKTTIKKVL